MGRPQQCVMYERCGNFLPGVVSWWKCHHLLQAVWVNTWSAPLLLPAMVKLRHNLTLLWFLSGGSGMCVQCSAVCQEGQMSQRSLKSTVEVATQIVPFLA